MYFYFALSFMFNYICLLDLQEWLQFYCEAVSLSGIAYEGLSLLYSIH